jgi:hypothetical protein
LSIGAIFRKKENHCCDSIPSHSLPVKSDRLLEVVDPEAKS